MNNTPRAVAIEVLCAVLVEHRHADDALATAMARLHADADRRFVHVLVYGVLRHYFSLEADVCRFVKRKPEDAVRMALLLGAFQWRHLQTPAHATVGETVEAVRCFQPKACGMVNAVLRRLIAQSPPARLKPHQRLELPQWLYRCWRDEWGADTLQQWFHDVDSIPPLTIAVRAARESWLQGAASMGLLAQPASHVATGVLLPGGTDVRALPGFAEGECWVMDQSAQASVHLLVDGLSASPAQVVDVCAAPGGKTAMLSALLPQTTVIAVEVHARRMARLRENQQRLRWMRAQPVRADARLLPFADASIEALFLDAPCTASGLLRKHPDVRFLHDEAQLQALVAQQQQLLAEAARVLRPGACMVYAVCAVHRQEQAPVLPAGLAKEAVLRIFPDTERDGFYAVRLRKQQQATGSNHV